MKNFILSIVFLIVLAIQNSALANERFIPISVISEPELSSSLSQENIISIAKETLEKYKINISTNGQFLIAKIMLVNNDDDNYLLVFLPHKKDLKFETIKIALDKNNYPVLVTMHYKLTPEDFHNQSLLQTTNQPLCPDPSVTFVAASPMYSDFKNVKEVVDKEYETAKTQGYVPYKLIDNQATIANYLNWLSCPNLKAFAHIGHGHNSAILLTDGLLNVDTIKKNVQLNQRTMLSFNSCEVFNDPMKLIVINDVEAQRFSGGINDLLIFGSVETYGCAFNKMITDGISMTTALATCEIKYDPSVKDSQSPVYVINFAQNDNISVFPVYILTEKSTKPIVLNSLGSDAQLDLSKNNALKEIYIMTPTGKVECNQFSKEKGLRAKEYVISLLDAKDGESEKTCQIEEESVAFKDQYGLGGNGSDYLLR